MSDFLWGVATSAYQSEGGLNGPGQPQNNWGAHERSGSAAVSGHASDFWNRWEEDLERCRALGLNAFRLGIEWARVQPDTAEDDQGAGITAAAPPFDLAALDRYAEIIAGTRRAGLEPVVTLHHFTHPAWLGTDPWLPGEADAAVRHFETYVRATVQHVNRALTERHGVAPVRFWITVNEPNMLVLNTYFGRLFPAGARSPHGFTPLVEASAGLLRAHVAGYNAVHDVYEAHGWPQPMVTLNTFCSDLYWGDKVLLDLLLLRSRGVPAAEVLPYLKAKSLEFRAARKAARLPMRRDLPYFFGFWARRLIGMLLRRAFFRARDREMLLEAVESSPRPLTLDFIALDYYDPFVAHLFRLPHWRDLEGKSRSVRGWMMNTVTSKWWDWRVLPAGLEFFCRHYSADLGGLPVLIAENGCALRRPFASAAGTPRPDGLTRSEFLRQHVAEITRCVRAGVPLMGYLHWSLFDNYEWGTFSPRFGLYSIDYGRGTERHVADPSSGDRPAETYAALVREARQAMAAEETPAEAKGHVLAAKGA